MSFLDTAETGEYHRATLDMPDDASFRLNIGLVRKALRRALVGRKIIYRLSVTSTMDVARQMAEEGAGEGTVVVAEEQTSGRGRFGRRWLSTPGQDLSFSVVLYPGAWACSRLSVAASVAAVRAVRRLYGLAPMVKWPNDVRLNGKKLCGILVETALEERKVRYAILGIGVNVNSDPAAYGEGAPMSTSLQVELGKRVSREEVLGGYLWELDRIYGHMQGWADTWDEWQARMEMVGRQVQVRWGQRVEEGLAEGVDGDGNLLLRRGDGTVVSLAAGEVTFQV